MDYITYGNKFTWNHTNIIVVVVHASWLMIRFNEHDTCKNNLHYKWNGSLFTKNKMDRNFSVYINCEYSYDLMNHHYSIVGCTWSITHTKQPWLPLLHESLVLNGVNFARTYVARSSTASTRWMWWTSGRRANHGVIGALNSAPKFKSQVCNFTIYFILKSSSTHTVANQCFYEFAYVAIFTTFQNTCFVTKCRNTYGTDI
jgi:hypothetical protein